VSYKFSFTPQIVKDLQAIERVKEMIRLTVLSPALAEKLRQQANIRSAHFSTRIEGNRLTFNETEQVIQQGKLFPGRERDVKEVEHYYQALQIVHKWVEDRLDITEDRIMKLHAMLFSGRRAKPSPYRDGQNVVRDGEGTIVYMPPEAHDVPGLMSELIDWIHSAQTDYAAPVIAGVAHYQFVTIHPFYDGNGRSARMLATWILHKGGYDLGKFYALEEFYADDLDRYYNALITHPHHNYYFGRHEAEITSWLDYFIHGMALVFEKLAHEITDIDNKQEQNTVLMRLLDQRARRVLGLFIDKASIQSSDVAWVLGISVRQARELLGQWTEQGWLVTLDASKRARKYGLAEKYQTLI